MVSPDFFIKTLQNKGINFFAGVPDSLLKNVCAYITDNVDPERNIITANEGSAVAIATGHYLATDEIPLIYMQNSGIGNAINPLLSLVDEKVYSIPMLLMIGWRGEPGVHDEPQHIKQGEVTLPLLDAMDIPYSILPEDNNSVLKMLDSAISNIRECKKPYAIIVRKGTFGSYKLHNEGTYRNFISRESALKIVLESLPSDSVIISTTGKLSRELYEYRDDRGLPHASDFLTVGSMGHSSSIALGIALAKKNRNVFCFDGDGAFIMHMGAITNIGDLAPKNLIHVLFNNGAHESVGGQPTLGFKIDIPAIAKACGYKHVYSESTSDGIKNALTQALKSEGPTIVEIRVGIDSRENLGRPKSTPLQNKEEFMNFINL